MNGIFVLTFPALFLIFSIDDANATRQRTGADSRGFPRLPETPIYFKEMSSQLHNRHNIT